MWFKISATVNVPSALFASIKGDVNENYPVPDFYLFAQSEEEARRTARRAVNELVRAEATITVVQVSRLSFLLARPEKEEAQDGSEDGDDDPNTDVLPDLNAKDAVLAAGGIFAGAALTTLIVLAVRHQNPERQ